MSVHVKCPYCGDKQSFPETLLGKRIRCPVCNEPFTLVADMAPVPTPPSVGERGRVRRSESPPPVGDEESRVTSAPRRKPNPNCDPGSALNDKGAESSVPHNYPRMRRTLT